MSTNKTANYQLNQWVKSDRVLMEDFNADNAKIDAALSGLAARTGLVPLNEITLTEASKDIRVPLKLDWSEWKIIHIDVSPAAGSNNQVYFCASYSYADKALLLPVAWSHIVLLPFGRADMPFTAILWGTDQKYYRLEYYKFAQCTGIAFVGEAYNHWLTAGSKIIVRGEKM